jgi:hypothetical protein
VVWVAFSHRRLNLNQHFLFVCRWQWDLLCYCQRRQNVDRFLWALWYWMDPEWVFGGLPDLMCTWRAVPVYSWGPSACSPETCCAEPPGRRIGWILSRLQIAGPVCNSHMYIHRPMINRFKYVQYLSCSLQYLTFSLAWKWEFAKFWKAIKILSPVLGSEFNPIVRIQVLAAPSMKSTTNQKS